ncbi:type III-A CRISPR-associated RAMP protein Csm4 [Fundicoccus culcitae]|uniref:CRISPR system Cms protein Csm4 n=1 Tax=Fundicoccus culcitae TaxID=2969821 RepID=A0ABY5P4P9_9LACT|nr:type III-A CRISPR-associated RAMP protein Csm4 [Fundicoccus culcitae]UUX33729.1 type III-A CRISPR-associated RAMP protein Csm4 [Fundicoccus culcitae]
MKLKLYIMKFKHAHFGDGMLNESVDFFEASRLYSALYLEAITQHKEEAFIKLTQSENFHISDAFPYDVEPFLPKPIGYPKVSEESKSIEELKTARQNAKAVKKITYIPLSEFDNYLSGKGDLTAISDRQKDLSQSFVAIRKGVDPYEVGIRTFKYSLYVVASQSDLFDNLMSALQYSGLGGKRTSGLGQFDLTIKDLPDNMLTHISGNDYNRFVALTSSLPTEEELTVAVTNANYLLKKASGFAYSPESKQLLRKQDVYKFRAGSTFTNKYQGSILNVEPDQFPHPVWHFARGLFYGINISSGG